VLRKVLKIPACFYSVVVPGKFISFDHCDHSIMVYPDGQVTETWVGLNASCTAHEFITRDWKPEKERSTCLWMSAL
jgi:hypothetical protein